MDNMVNKRKVGYIDEESQWVDKFVLRLKDKFEIITFNLTAEKSLSELIEEIEEQNLDCLVVDFDLKEADIVQFNGDEIIESIRKRYPYFPVFIITAKEEDDVLGQVEDNDIVRLKEELNSRPAILIQRIENKIESYYKQIEEANKVIREFNLKKNTSAGLSILEEEELTECYLFLDKINPNGKILPSNLTRPEAITKLTEFVSATKQILEELKKIDK